jgi:hypothetical protein
VLTAAMDERGIDVLGGQLTRNANVSQLLESMVEMATTGMQRSMEPNDELFKLMDERDKLQREFNEIRAADYERIKGKKKRGGSKRGAAKAPKKAK